MQECIQRLLRLSDELGAVSLTERGRVELTRLDAVVDRAQTVFLAPLAAEERGVFLDMITRLGREPGTPEAESPSSAGHP